MDPIFSLTSRRQKKVFLLITFWRYIYIIFQRWKVKKNSQNRRNQGFSYYFCLMIEGYGSEPLTNGSGSVRPKNIWIRQIRIRNTWVSRNNITQRKCFKKSNHPEIAFRNDLDEVSCWADDVIVSLDFAVGVHTEELLAFRVIPCTRCGTRARIFKRLWSPGIDSKEWIPPAYVAWRAGMITLFLLGS